MSSPSAALPGRSLPRVRRTPRARRSDVDDAVYLASAYGLTADPWQEDVLESWLGIRADSRWAAATCGLVVPRQNGKNGVIEIRELFGMVGLGERFLHTAHEVKTARKAFLRIVSFFENEREFPELAALVKDIRKTNGQEAVMLTNGGSVEFIARSKGSGRGFTVDVLVCDEAQDLTDEELAALLPTISAAPLGNPQVILTGTPPDPDKHQTGEVIRRVRADGEAGRDPRLAWTDYGVPDGPLPDVDDRATWQQVNPAMGGRLNIAEAEREWRMMSADTFARERLGWWGDPKAAEGGPLDLTRWASLTDRSADPPSRVCMVIDVAPDRKHSSLGVAGDGPDGRTLLMVRHGAGTGWVVAEAVRYAAKNDIVEVALNPSSQAGALIADLEAAGLTVERLTSQEMGQACASFIEGVNGDEARYVHLGQPELDAAVANARTRFTNEVERWDRRNWSIDISPLVACSAAALRWAACRVVDYDPLDSIY